MAVGWPDISILDAYLFTTVTIRLGKNHAHFAPSNVTLSQRRANQKLRCAILNEWEEKGNRVVLRSPIEEGNLRLRTLETCRDRIGHHGRIVLGV